MYDISQILLYSMRLQNTREVGGEFFFVEDNCLSYCKYINKIINYVIVIKVCLACWSAVTDKMLLLKYVNFVRLLCSLFYTVWINLFYNH